MIISGRTMIPLRFLCDSLKINVKWNSDTKLIELNRKFIPGEPFLLEYSQYDFNLNPTLKITIVIKNQALDKASIESINFVGNQKISKEITKKDLQELSDDIIYKNNFFSLPEDKLLGEPLSENSIDNEYIKIKITYNGKTRCVSNISSNNSDSFQNIWHQISSFSSMTFNIRL